MTDENSENPLSDYTSTLVNILPQLQAGEDVDIIKSIIHDHLFESEIDEEDKEKILFTIGDINNRKKLEKYIYNSILFFEGHSLNNSPKNKPKPPKKASKRYFTKDTENAIILYNNTEDPEIRSKIYEKDIHYAFFKLTENIIHTFKFYYTEVADITHLQHEIITFLLSKIHLFNQPQKIEDKIKKTIGEFKEGYHDNFVDFMGGDPYVKQADINNFLEGLIVSEECMDKLLKITPPKAYSYFGTITKNYLIISNNKNYKKRIEKIPFETLLEHEDHSYQLDEETKDSLSDFVDLYIDYITKNIFQLFPKPQDAKTADAILELFRKRDNLEIFNKKALYIYIREMVDVKTPKITKIANKLAKIFKEKYIFYLDNGYVNF